MSDGRRPGEDGGDAEARCALARAAQGEWSARPLAARVRVIEGAARLLAGEAPRLAALLSEASGQAPAALWSAEILPTLDALRWLARDGARHLAPQPLRRSRLQWYVRATRHALTWDPFGVVGVITPGNAPLFLSVPQVAAALLAGNGVLWKPAPAGDRARMSTGDRARMTPGVECLAPALRRREPAGRRFDRWGCVVSTGPRSPGTRAEDAALASIKGGKTKYLPTSSLLSPSPLRR